jgi:hypothetical protein
MADLIIPRTGPRVTPLLPTEVNRDVRIEYEKSVIAWGIPNNLIRTMARSPQLALTEVDYANSFIFDDGPYINWPRPGSPDPGATVLFQAAGFIEPITKELVINLVSLVNRSRYSITHHSVIAFNRICAALDGPVARRPAKAEAMLLNLVDARGKVDFENQTFEGQPLYGEIRLEVLRFAVKMHANSHAVTDEDIGKLKAVFRPQALRQIVEGPLAAQFGSAGPDAAFVTAYIDGMLVELTWCIAHFGGLLNHWFTVLRVRDEDDPDRDGIDFVAVYNKVVPDSIKVRNNNLLGADGWGD